MLVLAFDIEGNGLNEVTLGKKDACVPEADRIWCAATCNVETGETQGYKEDELGAFMDALDSADVIIGHNIFGYDIPLLERLIRKLKIDRSKIYDTLVVSRMMWPDKPMLPGQSHSLEAWGKMLNESKIEYTGGWDVFSEDMLQYCIQDTVVAAAIFKYQCGFREKNSKAIAMELKVSNIISQQVENGFSFDLGKAEELERDLMIEKAQIEDEMHIIFPDKVELRYSEKTGRSLKSKITSFNPGSRQQIAERLFEKYGWVSPTTDKGNPQVDRSILDKLEYPEAKTLVRYFDSTKLMSQVSDWIRRARCSRDGKIHGGIITLGTVTGRMTSNNPNMQQVSGDKRARELFVPRDGWVLVGSDLSGLELRMLAHYLYPYDDGAYAKQILDGDIHTHNQNAMGLDSRNKAKSAIYCFLYGGGDARFGSVVGISKKKSKEVKKQLLSNIPGLKKVIDSCVFETHSRGCVRPFEWRDIPVRSEHSALNTLLQSSGAHIAKLWACFCEVHLNKKFGSRWAWVANVHDEIQFECQADIAHELGKEVCLCATRAGKFLDCKIRIDAEYRVGSNWSQTH